MVGELVYGPGCDNQHHGKTKGHNLRPPRRVTTRWLSQPVAGAGEVYVMFPKYRTGLHDEFHVSVDALLEKADVIRGYVDEYVLSDRFRGNTPGDVEPMNDLLAASRVVARIYRALIDERDRSLPEVDRGG